MSKIQLKSTFVVGVAILAFAIGVVGQSKDAKDPWEAWSFMMGKWATDPGGVDGGTGSYSFATDLGGSVLVRHNHAEYPPALNRPATTHDDLMIVYHNPDGTTKAEYFDNEGHHIAYSVDIVPDSSIFRFVSDANASGPRFRLTYVKLAADSVDIIFDIAPPGKPDAFSKYLSGTAHRTK